MLVDSDTTNLRNDDLSCVYKNKDFKIHKTHIS